ncbi:hypothetical protein [Segniliparus rugosus]|uniref:hypothetical protein n=1 Tax=Segniliparus rugosus TaxID=286804 RepID=UPI0012EC4305|nr:hypothetical protein [Segniliparus rugosus]
MTLGDKKNQGANNMAPSSTRAVIAATAMAALALAGCDRGSGSGGTTTIIQQPATTSSSASTSPAKPVVVPLSDPKELCREVRRKTRDLQNAFDSYWKLVQGVSFDPSDPKVEAAVKRVEDAQGKDIPLIEGIVAPNAPSNVGDPVKEYIQASKDFSDSITGNGTKEELNSSASHFGNARDALETACKIS